MRHPSLPALLALMLPCAGCGVAPPEFPVSRFERGELQPVADYAREHATAGPVENQALALNVLAQCELLQGDLDAAWRHFGAAARIMGNWQVAGSEEFAAIVGSESSKGWTGDPYERAMNAWYLGLCYLWRGEPDNARAAFKKGILADGETSDEKFRADFTLLFWMAGRMSLRMGSPGEAGDLFREARDADAFARAHGSRGERGNPLLAEPAAGNLVVFAEVGMGPEKVAVGDEQELARFRARLHPAVRAQVWVDGRLRGPTWTLVDVDYQARTRGGTEMEGIRKGKAVFKAATRAAGIGVLVLGDERRHSAGRTATGLGLLLLSALTSTAADVRHWPTLPSTVQALALDVEPGQHELRIDFLTAAGTVLPGLTQLLTVTVPADEELYVSFRSIPGRSRLPMVTP
ncbi:MAG: hypothetical protein AB7O97_02145 [Planctomycetota bacterium]